MTDPEIRDEAIKEFMDFAVSKFNNGIREHNSCGTKGLWRMTPLQLCRAIKEEAADQWFYANTIEQKLLAEQFSTNAGRCLPDELGNVLRRRENLERLPKPVDLSNSSEAFTEFRAPSKQATNGSANSYLYVVITQSSSPPSAGIVETAPIVWTTPAIRHRDSTAPIIQIPRETEAEDSTECRKLKNLTFANLLLFVWLLAHVGQTLPRTGTAEENFGAKGTPCGGRARGSVGCCFFLETAKTMELQKFQNEDDKQSGLV